jgi:Rap1a immunity proteins
MRHATSLPGSLALLAVIMGPAQAQTTAGDAAPAAVVSTRALADLCAATGPDSAPAVAYCRGFFVGVGQYHVEISQPGGRLPIFCLPNPTPSMESAQAAFVAWVRANPQYAEEKAVDGVLRWAQAAYPCARPAAKRR